MDDLETRLLNAGEAFRRDHQRAAQPVARRRRSLLVPLMAGLATAAVIASITLVLPDRSERRAPPIADATQAVLDLPDVSGLAVNDDWVALTSLSAGDEILQVRRRSDLRVSTTITTTFTHGGPVCPHLEGDQVFWTDNEVIPSHSIPGPIGRWSLWQKDLRTGKRVQLDAGSGQTGAGHGFYPCLVGADSVVAWQPDQRHLTVLTLSTGSRTTSSTTSELIGVARGEAVTAKTVTMCVDCPAGVFPTGLGIIVRGREVARVDGGVSAFADKSHLIVFARKKGAETTDGQLVWLCSLRACTDVKQIADDPASGNAVLGSTFVLWSSLRETPTIYRFDGGKAPDLAEGPVFFRAVAAFGDELAYVSRPGYNELGDSAPTILHITAVTGRS